MITAPTQKLLDQIEITFQYYKGKFPNINDKVLYNRIYNGYVWLGTEGTTAILTSIEAWDKVFSGDESYTIFKDWNEYLMYHGDFSKHPKHLRKKHLSSISAYTFNHFIYSLSLRERIAFDLGYIKANTPSYSKELDFLTEEELKEKGKTIKKPWWNEAYEKYLKGNRKLSLMFLYIPFIGKIYLWRKSKKN